ncbi:hypothetical protein [Bradyrhizobium sp. Tv2a-2]|uniref:hypothetical protein n=1 Tax=Bradyrhizobium sp. Tv2a-2 TaxID=113395 RepID=UPI00046577DB|nr:hypothetical protein [Bradyrhizobium sp. Tv2a-2]
MSETTYGRQSEMDSTKASARLPGVDIDIVHQRSPNGEWEQISINLRATPSFEALGSLSEVADPFAFWLRAARLMWMPWLLTAQTMMLSDGRTPTLPSPAKSSDV